MKRVVRRSGRETDGPKWQNSESTSSENDDSDDTAPIGTTAALTEINAQTSEGISRRRIRLSSNHDSMYRATLECDCVAVVMLLLEHPNLASDEISQRGDRALHVAAAMKNTKIVGEIVKKMSPSDLALLDGNGYTACCYAALSGRVDIADILIRKSPTLVTARDRENKTPLYKAAFRGNAEMVSCFLKCAIVEDLPAEEWFDLLLVTIRREMYGVAVQILVRNEQLATMSNVEGTALHLLARQRLFVCYPSLFDQFRANYAPTGQEVKKRHMSLLAKKLWEGIQRLGHTSAVELMKNPPILHDAAEVGNVELITMITHTYPELVWHTNSKGYTIFHIAVIHRKASLFRLINEIGESKDLIAVSQDEDGNNILHLAAKTGCLDRSVRMFQTFRLHRETMWFKEVRATVPPFCSEMINKNRMTPRELFFEEHKKMVEYNTTLTRSTADSWRLVSTIIFSVVFSAAFAVPGGYDDKTGIPLLFKSNWFTCFVVFEGLAMFFSTMAIFCFSVAIMQSEEDFFDFASGWVAGGLVTLSLSTLSTVSVVMSASFLVYMEGRAALVKSLIIIAFIFICYIVIFNLFAFLGSISLLRMRRRHSLFKRHVDTVGEPRRRRRWLIL